MSEVMRVSLREYETRQVEGLRAEDVIGLQATRAVTSTYTAAGPTLTAAQFVGVVQVGSTEVRIRPKVKVAQLLFLLGFAHDPDGWGDTAADAADTDDLVSAVAHAFLLHSERALEAGVLHGYHSVDEAVTTLRGRVRVSDQMSRRFGLTVPAEVTYDEFDVDILENQLLRGAVSVLSRLGVTDSGVRRRLRRLDEKLWPAQVARPGHHSPPAWNRLNQRYRPAVTLARVLLEGRSLSLAVGSQGGRVFLFDMNRVFEDFLGAAMNRSFRKHGGQFQTQQTDRLDEGGFVTVKPDMVWRCGGEVRVVADAKYKSVGGLAGPSSDVYQALAYATAFRLKRAWLVYAAGNEAPNAHRVRNTTIDVAVATVPLSRSPQSLIQAVDNLVDAMVAAAGGEPVPLSEVEFA